MMIFTLLPRLLKRNGVRLLLAFTSLLVGALTLAIVLGLIGSIQKFFVSESQTLLGGDVTIETATPMDRENLTLMELEAMGVTFSERIDTLVVVQAEPSSDLKPLSSLLVSLKVVDETYPLYGSLETTQGKEKLPAQDEVFVAPDLLDRMGRKVGDSLTIGKAKFTIAGTIISEPDRVAGSFRLGPLVVISKAGWEVTGAGGTQSRASYILSLRFPETFTASQKLTATTTLQEAFPSPTYRLSLASDGPMTLLRILDAAEQFFFVIIVLALFLVVVNIRLNLIYFLASFQKTIAIMRSLGMRRGQILTLFLSLLLVLATLSGLIGGLIGNLVANGALPLVEDFVGSTLPAISLFDHVWAVTLFTLVLCFFSALGFLVRALSIEPKLLLLGYGAEHGGFRLLLKELPTLLLTLMGLYGAVYYLTQKPLVALIAVGSIALGFGLLFLLARLGIALGHMMRFRFSLSIRSILNFLKHQGLVGTTAIASLTIALTSIFSIALIEQNVLGNLGTEFKKDAPNLYLIDIQEDQLSDVRALMGPTWKDFSVIRARFTFRDGYDIQANLDTEDAELGREFNLTTGTELIEGEALVEGKWHGKEGAGEVSVEKDFAERAKLSLGSKVQFAVQGFPYEATVTSIREVNTTSGLPFFFLVFSPDVLEGVPRSSFGYAYVQEDQIPFLQNQLASTYPNISSIPTTQILETVEKVVTVLLVTVVATALPALLLGLILIFAMLALSARERANDMLVFTAFGAPMRLLFSIFLIESSVVVLAAGLFAALIAHSGVYILNKFAFNFKGFYWAPETIYLFVGILFMTLIIAYLFARRFIVASPKELLAKGK